MRCTCGWLVGLLTLLASGALAAPVAILNPGFEDLYTGGNLPPQYAGDVPPGAFPTGDPPAGWTRYEEFGVPVAGAFYGVLNPGTDAQHAPNPSCFPNGAPEGDNMALLFTSGDAGGAEYGIEQVLVDTLQPGTSYTLSVEVGDIGTCAGLVVPYTNNFVLDGFPGYRVELRTENGTLVVSDPGLLAPGDYGIQTSTIQVTTGASPPGVGERLVIRLVNENAPDVPGVDGLEVDFDDVRLDATPVVSTGPWLPGLLTAGLVAMGLYGRRRVRPR